MIAAIFAVVAIVSIAMAANSIITAAKDPTPTNITIAVVDTVGAVGAAGSGGVSAAVSKAAGVAIRAGAGTAAKKAAQPAINRAAGKEAERIAFERARAQYKKDYKLSTQQYFKVAGFNRGRFADITAYKGGQPVFNIEVKSGNARYGGVQAAKDQAILEQYGMPTYVERITLTGK